MEPDHLLIDLYLYSETLLQSKVQSQCFYFFISFFFFQISKDYSTNKAT